MSRRERRSVSLGRQRERGPRDHARAPDEDLSTRHNISNFLLTLQRIQASEEENRQLRKENQLLRQRTRSSRLSSASFRGNNSYDRCEQTTILPDAEDEIIAADVKRNSLMFVGDAVPPSPEHAALEAQYKKLQEDFETVKEFLKHLFQHALTMSSSDGRGGSYKEGSKDKENTDVNTYHPTHSKQLEHSLENIHGQISQLRNSQDQQQVKMEQVQQALDNVLCQSSVRNDVTMRIVRQQDKMKEITRYANFLEAQVVALSVSLRQAEEKTRQTAVLGQSLENFVAASSKNLKGNTKDELCKISVQLSQLGRLKSSCTCKMATVGKFMGHVTMAANQGQTLADSKPPADIVDVMTKLERLIGSDWHRLGRMLGLNSDCLDDIGKFTNFDLTSRVEKVVTSWARQTRGANVEGLRQGLDRMDRDILLITEQPVCKEWFQLPPEVNTYVIAHMIDVPSILGHLASQGILSQDSRNFILGATQEHRRAGRLLQSVVYMGVQAIRVLCAALDGHSQSLVANKIRGCLPSHFQSIDPNSVSPQTIDRANKPSPKYDMSPTRKTLGRSSRGEPEDTKTPSKTTSSSSSKSTEKQRKKRSRSLFTRKNKLRDSELDQDLAMDIQGEYNYYYPAINLNALNTSSSSSGHGGDLGRRDDLPPSGAGSNRRQYGRQNRPGHVNNSSEEVIV